MDLEKHIAYWQQGSIEDWDVGVRLVGERSTRHGLFFVHLAVEKLLKARFVGYQRKPAPRTHNLVRLASDAGIELDDDRIDLLTELTTYCLEGRYPDTWLPPPDHQEAQALVKRTGELYRWIARRH